MNKVSETRKKLGMTQIKLATLSGVSRQQVSKIESNKQSVIKSNTMSKISKALKSKEKDIFFD